MQVLLVEDEPTIAVTLKDDLEDAGHLVTHVADGQQAIDLLGQQVFDCVISDIRLPSADGLKVLAAAKRARPDTEVLMMTGYATVEQAVEAMRLGADDYIQKPFLNAHVVDRLARIARVRALIHENRILRQELDGGRGGLPGVIGKSRAMEAVFKTVRTVAQNDASVLIEGESGTGKDLAARAIHQLGKRKIGPFVAVSLAALQRDQVEEELFGAGRDDNGRRRGKVREADGGTLFLDEVGDMPLEAQTRLVRFLQDGRFASSGDDLDVRIIASTKHDLRALVDQGLFREDLYYRLNVVALQLPPLRERKEDIPDLASAFLIRAKKEGLPEKQLDKSAYDLLVAYDWPGNVRELENVIRRLSALSPEPVISAREVERELRSNTRTVAGEREFEQEIEALLSRHFISALSADPDKDPDGGQIYQTVIEQVERPLIKLALAATNGNKVRAAALLGLNRNTLRSKINGLGVAEGD